MSLPPFVLHLYHINRKPLHTCASNRRQRMMRGRFHSWKRPLFHEGYDISASTSAIGPKHPTPYTQRPKRAVLFEKKHFVAGRPVAKTHLGLCSASREESNTSLLVEGTGSDPHDTKSEGRYCSCCTRNNDTAMSPSTTDEGNEFLYLTITMSKSKLSWSKGKA
jgi:hypothetical protein